MSAVTRGFPRQFRVKNPPTKQETQVWSLGQEDPLEKEMATTLVFFANKGISSQSYFPVVMYGCESWTIKKTRYWRINAFQLWCWRKLLRVPWTASRSNQSILKEINPQYSSEGLMLELHHVGHLVRRTDSKKRTWCWKKLKAGGEGLDSGWDG